MVNMATKEKVFISLQQDYLERRIFLKKQLVALTQLEIEALEKNLTRVDHKIGTEARQLERMGV
jgi:hypothetical protein